MLVLDIVQIVVEFKLSCLVWRHKRLTDNKPLCSVLLATRLDQLDTAYGPFLPSVSPQLIADSLCNLLALIRLSILSAAVNVNSSSCLCGLPVTWFGCDQLVASSHCPAPPCHPNAKPLPTHAHPPLLRLPASHTGS